MVVWSRLVGAQPVASPSDGDADADVGAIHLIRSTTATGWDTMTDAVIELAQVFIIRTKGMCLRRMHKSDFGLGCCDYSVMSSGLDSLRKKLDTAHFSSTESAGAKNRAMGEVVLGALHVCARPSQPD